jgi:hypothetical protein
LALHYYGLVYYGLHYLGGKLQEGIARLGAAERKPQEEIARLEVAERKPLERIAQLEVEEGGLDLSAKDGDATTVACE